MSTLVCPDSFVSGLAFSSLQQALDDCFVDEPVKSQPSTTGFQGHEELLSAVVSALEELARSGHAASIEDLVSSKGKGDYENIKIDLTRAANDDNEVSDSEDVEEEPAIPPAPPAPSVVSLPPPPSALCDCHGAIACPFLSQQFSHFTCGICVDSFVPGKVRPYHSPNCHTNCCDDCLSETLSFSIRNGQVKNINCPSCNYHLMPSEVARRINAGDLEKYHRFLLEKLLAATQNVHRCNNPGCENAVIVEDECALENWKCESCSATCPFCRAPAHRGSCKAERKFKLAEARYKVWSAFSLSKKCPGCKTPIIKKGGCPHMTCKNPACGHQWCWHCKGDWDTHEMCIFTKLLIGGLVVISPAIIALGVGVVAAVFLPLAAVGGVTGNEVYNGRGLVIQMWKLFKKLKREFF